MSYRLVSHIIKTASLLPSDEAWLLIQIADFVNDQQQDFGAWPSVSTLARLTGVTERSVQRSLRKLEARGLVRVDSRPGKSNVYCLTFGCSDECSRRQHQGADLGLLLKDDTGRATDSDTPPELLTPDVGVTPTPDVGVTPPPTWASPKPIREPRIRTKKLPKATSSDVGHDMRVVFDVWTNPYIDLPDDYFDRYDDFVHSLVDLVIAETGSSHPWAYLRSIVERADDEINAQLALVSIYRRIRSSA